MSFSSVEKRCRKNLPLGDLVLTPDQSDQLDNRRSQFDAFYAELMPVLVDFCTCLELPNPYEVLSDPTPYISPVAQWVAAQDLLAASPDDRVWLSSRIGYFIGECFVHRYSGCWFVDDNPTSNWFAHFVVGQFPRYPNARIAPMQMAIDLVESAGELETYLADASTAIEASI